MFILPALTPPAPTQSVPSPAAPLSPRRLWALTAAALLLLMLWDATGADLALAQLAGTEQGFAAKANPWLTRAHDWGRLASATALLWLLVGVAFPTGVLRSLVRAERVWLLLVTIGAMLLVSVLKHASRSSCPWDLQAFGGFASHVSHWRWGQADGGPGRCFPAGHASAAFAFVSGYLALGNSRPAAARAWLAAALAAGLAFGVVQQWRGAHFASHTLWTAWLCWTFALACQRFLPGAQRHAPAAG